LRKIKNFADFIEDEFGTDFVTKKFFELMKEQVVSRIPVIKLA